MAEENKNKTQEQKDYRKLKKAIASLPKPAFNNPEKVQPKVNVPTAVPGSLMQESTKLTSAEDMRTKPTDSGIILDSGGKKIERVANVKLQKKRHITTLVLKYIGKNWWLLAISIFCGLANSVFEIGIPLITGSAIDHIVGQGNVDFAMVGKHLIALIVCIIGYVVLKWLTTKTANDLSYRIEQQMHNDIFNKFNRVPLKIIDASSHGDLQSRMINDVDAITDGFIEGLTTFFDCISSIVFTLAFMFKLNVPISVVIVCVTPLSVIVSSIIIKKTHDLFKIQAKELGELSGTLVEMIGNQKIVKAFEYEDRSIEKFDKINSKLRNSNEKASYYSSLTGPVSRFVNGILYAIVAIMGCLFAIKGQLSIGSISVLLSYANKYSRPFNDIADVFADLQAAYASAARVFSVLDIPNESSDAFLPEIKRCTGRVKFDHVDFSYLPDKKLITDLNLAVTKGQKIAIVGPTGCGKSTLINLLMRFYDVNKGKIEISGHDIRQITRASLRSHFGMVLQETWLFSASIRDNIAYGKPDATDKEIRNAAKKAGADFFIQTMPDGYKTIINENGDNLSQGQKQLLCIARLMLVRPPMLILDEATSNIDTRTELEIQAAFNKMMKGKTSFVVAHRLSTITSSDVILVMNKGNIIEQGSHEELMAKKGFYFNLYNSQFSNY